MKKTDNTITSESLSSLQEILDFCKANEIKESDYSKVKIVPSYRNCYYEGDQPEIIVKFKKYAN